MEDLRAAAAAVVTIPRSDTAALRKALARHQCHRERLPPLAVDVEARQQGLSLSRRVLGTILREPCDERWRRVRRTSAAFASLSADVRASVVLRLTDAGFRVEGDWLCLPHDALLHPVGAALAAVSECEEQEQANLAALDAVRGALAASDAADAAEAPPLAPSVAPHLRTALQDALQAASELPLHEWRSLRQALQGRGVAPNETASMVVEAAAGVPLFAVLEAFDAADALRFAADNASLRRPRRAPPKAPNEVALPHRSAEEQHTAVALVNDVAGIAEQLWVLGGARGYRAEFRREAKDLLRAYDAGQLSVAELHAMKERREADLAAAKEKAGGFVFAPR